MIRKAKLSEIPEILAVTNACGLHLASIGIFQWNEHYPSKQAFESDINRQELYVFVDHNRIIGGIVVSTIMDEEYRSISWLSENRKNIYIHRLFVHPKSQGQGIARQLMEFAEELAKTQNFVSVRLDTFSQNKRNQRFYENRGYQRLGDVFFPKQSEHPFHCYELVL
ncbi:GNAT family N-acetyltransferase [Croceivirga thetidis]|uniref:GNAT family N-acetyltransferase n=1 Tax=Croceivirga thetidis TaxID=2721623 RepID=A0ABX1GN78_9FLAO|nr:GNAT family N-acetyltransferase [Croceivirga thetidis]NKI31363.1 GNAT family N-acetyltransferase [Croceivirga thetidis]